MAANDGRMVSNFVVQALQDEPLTIYGDGSQTRSFCFVDDLIEGLVRLGTLESAPDGPINLGNERQVTIAEIVRGLTFAERSPRAVLIAHNDFCQIGGK